MSSLIVHVNIMGGLGNQMFQVATAYVYAKQHRAVLQIPAHMKSPNRPLYWDSVLARFRAYLVDLIEPTAYWCEQQPTKYTPIPPPISGIYLEGYFQSSKYFGEHANEIKQMMRPDPADPIDPLYSKWLGHADRVVIVHARQTDYLDRADIHNPLTYQYYIEATKIICEKIPNPIFCLVGDDLTYWERAINQIPAFTAHPTHILENADDISAIRGLQLFENFIIANSTFAWWFVWLARNPRIVIAPSRWFGPAGPSDYEDIYEPEWIRV